MKRTLIALLLLALFTVVGYSQHSWKKLDGPNGGHIQAVIAKPDGTLFAHVTINTTKRVLLRSRDHGQTWQDITPNLPQFGITISSQTYANMAVPTFTVLPNGNIAMLFKNDVTSRLYISSNDCDNWTAIRDSVQSVKGYGKPGEFFISSIDKKIYHTTDGGANWKTINAPLNAYCSIVWLGGEKYFAYGGAKEIYLSDDNCVTWRVGNTFKDQTYNSTIEDMHQLRDGNFIARIGMTLYQSDLKNPWTIVDTLTKFFVLSTYGISNFYLTPKNEFIGLVITSPVNGDNCTIHVFDTSKKDFVAVPSMPVSPYSHPGSTGSGPQKSLFASDTLGWLYYTDNTALYRTSNLGNNWEELPIHYQDVNTMNVDGYGRIFAKSLKSFTNSAGTIHGWEGDFTWINMSQNEGHTWQKISPLPFPVAGLLGPGYERGTIVSAAYTNCQFGMELYYYGGLETSSWTKLTPTSEGGNIPGYILVDSADNVFVADVHTNISTDRGITWDNLPTPEAGYLSFSPSWTYYMSDGYALFVSSDFGQQWKKINIGIRQLNIRSILVPSDDNIYLVTDSFGIYRSVDYGASWKHFDGPWGDSINCMKYTHNTLFIGTEHRGLYSTSFNGSSPVREPLDLPTDRIFTLHVDRWGNLYVGAEASPIWVLNASSGVAETGRLPSAFEGKIIYSATDGSAMLELTSSVDQVISVDLYDVLGKKCQSIRPAFYSSGKHPMPLSLNSYAQGTYFVRISSEHDSKIIPVIH